MKKLIRVLIVALLAAVFLLPVGVSAESASEIDGLGVKLSTEKKSYEEGEELDFSLTFTNGTRRDMQNIRVELLLPEGMSPSRGTSQSVRVDALKKGSFVLSGDITAESDIGKLELDTKDATKETNLISIFGYILLGLFVAGIAVCVILIIKRPERTTKIVAIALAALMLIGSVPVGIIAFSGRDIIIYLDESVLVNGEKVKIGAKITKLRDKHSQDISLDLGGAMYDTKEKLYYVFDDVTTLNGVVFNDRFAKNLEVSVRDCNEKLLFEAELDPENELKIEKFGLIVGVNTVDFKITHKDGFVYEERFTINNLCEENMKHLEVDKADTDGDGVLNFTEELYHTDPTKPDTDDDRLSDYVEMVQVDTDPLLPDTDGDGITDADEDTDGDGATNIDEVKDLGTNPGLVDTDLDGLTDGEETGEAYEIFTDPTKPDTDDDGKTDKWELDKGYNPKVPNDDFPKFECASEVAEIELQADGEAKIEEVEGDLNFYDGMPGSVGVPPFELTIEEGSEAEIYIDIEPEYIGEDIGGYSYDETTQLYNEVSIEWVDDDTVKMSTNKSGMYILLNNRHIADVWENDIFRPSESTDGSIDIVFVIDRSASMEDNDPDRNRIEVTKKFIEKLRDGKDRASVVQFSAIGELLVPMTSDKEALINAADGIVNSDGGGCAGSDENAGTNGAAGLRCALTQLEGSTAKYKYIILLTDGKDTHNDESYGNLSGTEGITGEAKSKGIVIHTVGLIGTGEVDTDLLLMVAAGTNGKYYQISVSEDGAETEAEFIKIYDEIESVTIDRQIDSNNDGISDYYTRLITEGNISTTSGNRFLFGNATFDEVQANADFDGDGIKNGDELKIAESTDGVYVMLFSYPHLVDSDGDGLTDPEEAELQLGAIKYNANTTYDDYNWLTNEDNFQSAEYLESYMNSSFKQDAVFIGNAFFGTTIDQTRLYRQQLVSIFSSIDEKITKEHEGKIKKAFYCEYLEQLAKINENEIYKFLKNGEKEGALAFCRNFYEFCDDFFSVLGVGFEDEFGSPLSKLPDLIESAANAANKGINEINFKIFTQRMKKISASNFAEPEFQKAAGDAIAKWMNSVDDMFKGERFIKIGTGKLTKAFDGLKKAGDFLEKPFLVINIGLHGYDAVMDCLEAMAALETVADNMYILDAISVSDDVYLRSAACQLRAAVEEAVQKGTNDFLTTLAARDFTESAVLEVAHYIIGNAGLPGAIIEAVRVLGDLLLDASDNAENAVSVVASANTAKYMAMVLRNHVEGGFIVVKQSVYYAYANYSYEMLNSILNLIVTRIEAESVFSKWDCYHVNDKFKVNGVKTSRGEMAKANIEQGEGLLETYNSKFGRYLDVTIGG